MEAKHERTWPTRPWPSKTWPARSWYLGSGSTHTGPQGDAPSFESPDLGSPGQGSPDPAAADGEQRSSQPRYADLGYADLGYAKVDHDRARRTGVAEVVFGQGKTTEQIAGICRQMLDAGQECVLVTRLDADKAAQVAQQVPLAYHEQPRLGVVGQAPEPDGNGTIVVACAGTSDLPVAEEAALTAEVLGNRVLRLYDVGVAGIHRLLSHEPELHDAQVIIAVAGMEGALPSVIAGLVACPVLAVPTSVGYGASFGGVTALLAMLNSCASGVSVVNIDNGFGAAYQAHQINHL